MERFYLLHIMENEENIPPPTSDSEPPNADPPKANPKHKPKPKGFGRRHFTVLMLFFGMANAYVMRTNMSVAIVAMSDSSNIYHNHLQDWSAVERGTVLSSFFYGYIVTQIPIGFMTKKYDALKMLGWGMMLNALFAIVVPLSSHSFWTLGMARFIQGLGEGPIVPCTHAILAKWVPPAERSFLVGLVYSGAQFGTIISYPVSGFLAYHEFLGGWPAIFYVFGAICFIWCVLFLNLVKENPSIDPHITEEEKDYILYPIFGGDIIEDLKDSKVPWRDIMHSTPFLAILVAHMGQNFGFETVMTMMPTFLKDVFHFDIKTNGLISATPYMAMFLSSLSLNTLADWLIGRKILSTGATRKLMTGIGEIGPGSMFILLALLEPTRFTSITCLILAMACNGAIYAGFKVNHIDISPCFAGILMSITNCAANVLGMLAPTVSGILLHVFRNEKRVAWSVVFLVSAFMYIVCATVYLLFASGKKQDWDRKTAKAILASNKI